MARAAIVCRGVHCPQAADGLGWVVQAAQAAVAIAQKLGVFNKKIAKSEAMWEAYKPISGQAPGSQMEACPFELAFEGMWKTNNKRLAGLNKQYPDRESFKQWLISTLARAIVDGKISGTVTAEGVAGSFLFPYMDSLGAQYQDYAAMRQIFVDLVDRALHDIPIGRNAVPGCVGSSNAPPIPKLTDAVAAISPQTAAAMTQAPAGAAPAPSPSSAVLPGPAAPPAAAVVPPTIATPPILPASPTVDDIRVIVDDITRKVAASSQGLTQDQVAAIANNTALQYLSRQGVQTSQPVVQQAVAQQAQSSASDLDWKKWVIPGVFALSGVFVAYLLSARRR